MIAAIRKKDFVLVDQALFKFPRTEEWTTDELPVANPETLDGSMEVSVLEYLKRSRPHPELLAYAQWCDRHHGGMSTVDAAMAVSTALGDCIHPDVKEVCLALRRIDEAADEARLSRSIHVLMKKIAASTDTLDARALAQQPYASVHLMMQKMPLLSRFHAGKHVDALREKLMEAHKIRVQAINALRQAVSPIGTMGPPPIPVIDAEWVRHCVSIYGHCMTLPTDPLPEVAQRERLDALHKALELHILQPAEPGLTALERVALRYVSDCIGERLAVIDKRPDLPSS